MVSNEQLNKLVNWLREIRFLEQVWSRRTKFRFKGGERGTWPTLDPLGKVIKWGTIGEEMEESKEVLLEIWSKAPESSIHGLWFSTVWEMQVVDELDFVVWKVVLHC